jgi:hypothetical protein
MRKLKDLKGNQQIEQLSCKDGSLFASEFTLPIFSYIMSFSKKIRFWKGTVELVADG